MLLDGSIIDLTQRSSGTTYTSSDLEHRRLRRQRQQDARRRDRYRERHDREQRQAVRRGSDRRSFQPVALSSVAIPGYANMSTLPATTRSSRRAARACRSSTSPTGPSGGGCRSRHRWCRDRRARRRQLRVPRGWPRRPEDPRRHRPAGSAAGGSTDTAGVAQDLEIQDDFRTSPTVWAASLLWMSATRPVRS